MGTVIRLAPVTRVTGTSTQSVSDVVDVLAFDRLDVYVTVYEASGASPSITFKLQTSMQNVLGDGANDQLLWVDVGSSVIITTSNKSEVVAITSGLLRYVRWVATFGGTTSACTFEMTAVGRPG